MEIENPTIRQPLFCNLPFILIKARKSAQDTQFAIPIISRGWELETVLHAGVRCDYRWDSEIGPYGTPRKLYLHLKQLMQPNFQPLHFVFTMEKHQVTVTTSPIYCMNPAEDKATALARCFMVHHQSLLQQVLALFSLRAVRNN